MVPNPGAINLEQITQFLDLYFDVHRYEEGERGGIYLPTARPISRLGLALEAWPQIGEWVHTQQLDGLFLHRPWLLEVEQLPPDVGAIAYHLPFDECLTLGFNQRLAQVLGMVSLEVLGRKQGRAMGMIGDIRPQSWENLSSCVHEMFAGQEKVIVGEKSQVSRLAVVGGMTDALIREAAGRGVDVYITGQLRQPALDAVLETKISVIAVGHRRCELWGLRALAGILQERWFRIKVVVLEN